MRRLVLFAVATLLYAAAIAEPSPPPRRPPAEFALELSRPALLPTLWASLRRARETGDPRDVVRTGRLITSLLPEWTEGHVHFAWQLAYQLGENRLDRARQLDLLDAARSWLEEAQDRLAERGDRAGAAEILMALAVIVENRTMRDPEFAAAFRTRHRQDATELADTYVARAIELAPSDVKRDIRAYLSVRLIAGALRMRDLPRARSFLEAADRRLARSPDQETAADARADLALLRRYFDGDGQLTLADLARREYLDEIVEALRQFPDGTFR